MTCVMTQSRLVGCGETPRSFAGQSYWKFVENYKEYIPKIVNSERAMKISICREAKGINGFPSIFEQKRTRCSYQVSHTPHHQVAAIFSPILPCSADAI